MLHPHSLPLDEEVQVCTEVATGKQYVFATRLMLQHCISTNAEKFAVVLTTEMYQQVIKSGLNQRKMRNLRRGSWRKDYYKENEKRPLLFAQITPDFHFLADGNHRFAYLYEQGAATAISYIMEEHEWKQFLVGDV